jgi:hypothetical protein
VKWHLENRATPHARKIADRHYNRQKIGATQFVPPGRCMVLAIPGEALWVTSWPFAEYVKHAWGGAWMNSAFRNERPDLHLSSDLIREAVAATRWQWPEVPVLGMVTFVDESKVRHKRDPGRCYRKAGFTQVMKPVEVGGLAVRIEPARTAGGLLVFQMLPTDMPAASAPLGAPMEFLFETSMTKEG